MVGRNTIDDPYTRIIMTGTVSGLYAGGYHLIKAGIFNAAGFPGKAIAELQDLKKLTERTYGQDETRNQAWSDIVLAEAFLGLRRYEDAIRKAREALVACHHINSMQNVAIITDIYSRIVASPYGKSHDVKELDGKEVIRDVVERPESVLVLPVGQKDILFLVEEYDFAAGVWQLTLPGGKVEQASLENIEEQAQKELRQETGYRANQLEKLVDFYNHPGYISHKVHAFLAQGLEWDPLAIEAHEEIQVKAYTLQEALDATLEEYRCDPEAALVLWLYAQKRK